MCNNRVFHSPRSSYFVCTLNHHIIVINMQSCLMHWIYVVYIGYISVYSVVCVSKTTHNLTVVFSAIYGAVCYQQTQLSCDDCENYALHLFVIIKSEVWIIRHCYVMRSMFYDIRVYIIGAQKGPFVLCPSHYTVSFHSHPTRWVISIFFLQNIFF